LRALTFRAPVAALVLVALSLGTLVARADAGGSPPYPVHSFSQMTANEAWWTLTGQNTARSAPGVNNWDCRPSAAHPDPVILVHGLSGNQYNGWAFLGPTLANAGYCVFSLNHGGALWDTFIIQGTRPVNESTSEIAAFVDKVRSRTGAAKVDLVGHSLGGFLVEYVPKVVPGMAAKVDNVVALAPPTHGTTVGGVTTLVDLLGLRPEVNALLPLIGCGACVDLLPGGPGVTTLNTGPIAQPGIAYTVLISSHDSAVTPVPDAAFIQEPGVHNILLQEVCPDDQSGHTGLAYNSGVATIVTNALDPGHPAPVACVSGLPF
jgi:pimeloyl-ACP methyl ester carboxylesterase